MNFLSKTVSVALSILFLTGTLVAHGAWQDPTGNPPTNNVPEPINVGGSSQTKEGQLWSNDMLGSYNSGYFQNNIDLGTSPPPTGQQDLQPRIGIGRTADTNDPAWTDALNMLLRVSGKIGATAYCDQNGANCSTPPFGGNLWSDGTHGIFYNTKPVIVGPDTGFDADLGATSTGWFKVSGKFQAGNEIRFPMSGWIGPATTDGADSAILNLTGGGGTTSGRGSKISLYGNEESSQNGGLWIESGDSTNSKIRINRYGGTGSVTVSQEFNSNGVTFDTSGSANLAINPSVSLWIGGTAAGVKIAEGATVPWTMTLPSSAGTSGQVLQTNGSGVTSWVNQSGGSGLWVEGTNGDYDNSDPVIVGADIAFDPDIPGTRGSGDLKATKLSVSDIYISNGEGIFSPTADGADDTWLIVSGGGDVAGGGTYSENRGGFTRFYGNENSTKPGRVEITAGAVTNSMITLAKWDNTLSQRIMELDIDQTGATFFGQTGSDVVVSQGLDFWLGGTTAGVKIAESAASPWTLTLPASSGASGQVLQTDGAGVTSWVNTSSGDNYYILRRTPSLSSINVFCDSGDVAVGYTLVGLEDQWAAWYINSGATALADRATNPAGVRFTDLGGTDVQVLCLDKN